MEQQQADAAERGALHYRIALRLRLAAPPQSAAALEQAARLAAVAGDRVLAAYVRFVQGSLLCLTGQFRQGLPEARAALDALDALPAAERVPTTATAVANINGHNYRGL